MYGATPKIDKNNSKIGGKFYLTSFMGRERVFCSLSSAAGAPECGGADVARLPFPGEALNLASDQRVS